MISPRQDLTAYLIVLRAAVETHGAPEVLVSDSGSIFKAKHARAIYAALGIQKEQIDCGQAWQNSIETNFNVMRRMADHDYAKATTWPELHAAPERFFHNYNHQSHFAHRGRTDDRQSPATVLGWVHGGWCDLTDLDRLFRIRSIRSIAAGGSIRFRHWRLYAERGLTGARAAVWVSGETLTVEYETETLTHYRVALEAGGRGLKEVTEPRFFATGHGSSQPFLPLVDEVEWEPAQRLSPYRARDVHIAASRQEPLFDLEEDAVTTSAAH